MFFLSGRCCFRATMITILIVGLFLLATTGLLTWRAVKHAALGYEDATGFHHGEVTLAARPPYPTPSYDQTKVADTEQ